MDKTSQLLKISEFATLSKISAQTLRLYEKKGILTPIQVEDNNLYRYYSASQLYVVKEIQLLQELGLTLYDIKKCIVGKMSIEYEIEQLTQLNYVVKQRLEIAKLQKKYDMRYSINITTRKNLYYMTKNVKVGHYLELVEKFDDLWKDVVDNKLKLTKPIESGVEFPYDSYIENNLQVKMFTRVEKTRSKNIVFVPEIKYLTCISLGKYDNLSRAYEFLFECAKIYNFKKAGNFSEVYLISPYQTNNETEYVTELRMPVE